MGQLCEHTSLFFSIGYIKKKTLCKKLNFSSLGK